MEIIRFPGQVFGGHRIHRYYISFKYANVLQQLRDMITRLHFNTNLTTFNSGTQIRINFINITIKLNRLKNCSLSCNIWWMYIRMNSTIIKISLSGLIRVKLILNCSKWEVYLFLPFISGKCGLNWWNLIQFNFYFYFQASTIDGRRKGACLFCQEYFMDLYLLAELKTISLKVNISKYVLIKYSECKCYAWLYRITKIYLSASAQFSIRVNEDWLIISWQFCGQMI